MRISDWSSDVCSSDLKPTADYVRELREKLPREFPGVTFSFLPADIVSQILNFGSPAPIDIQIRGPKVDADFDYAKQLLSKIRYVNGVADARIQQSQRYPTLQLNMDRARAEQLGVTARNVTDSMLISLVGTDRKSTRLNSSH